MCCGESSLIARLPPHWWCLRIDTRRRSNSCDIRSNPGTDTINRSLSAISSIIYHHINICELQGPLYFTTPKANVNTYQPEYHSILPLDICNADRSNRFVAPLVLPGNHHQVSFPFDWPNLIDMFLIQRTLDVNCALVSPHIHHHCYRISGRILADVSGWIYPIEDFAVTAFGLRYI